MLADEDVLEHFSDDERHSINLITFYYLRSKRPFTFRKLNSSESRARKILLYQIRYFPLVKQVLSYILAVTMRRRFLRLRLGIRRLQCLWRRKVKMASMAKMANMAKMAKMADMANTVNVTNIVKSHINHTIYANQPESEDELIAKEFDECDFLCPSPAVMFRGELLTTPCSKGIRVGGLVNSIRTAPSMATPVRTRKSTVQLVDHQLLALSPMVTPSLPIPPTTSLPSTPLPTASRRAQRVIRKGIPSTTISLPLRQISDEAELAKITQQNTLNNTGYTTCDIVVQDVVRECDRPESPSNRFCKSAAVAKRKWADLNRGRDLAQKAWSELHRGSSKSPKNRRIRWDSQVYFIDEPEVIESTEEVIRRVRPTRGALSFRQSEDPFSSGESSSVKNTQTVQRILYLSEIEPAKLKRTPIKRGKNQK